MPTAMPQLDVNTCSAWTENDRNLYNAYSFWLAKTQVTRRSTWLTFSRLIKKKKWKPNHGPVMRGVRVNFSPHLRQFATPVLLSQNPVEDVMNVTETTADAPLYWQEFGSPTFNFFPSFTDFLDHITDTGNDIMEKVERFEEIFYRGMIFHMAPFVYVAQEKTMLKVPMASFNGLSQLDATKGKTTADLANLIALHGGNATHLTLAALNASVTKLSVNEGIPFFGGADTQTGDNKPMEGKYLLITHEEAWDQFTFDPWLLQAKNCNLDIVHDQFRGSIFGRITSRMESLPMFMKDNGTFVAPEVRVSDPADLTGADGETQPNPEYADPAQSPWAWSYIAGDVGYEGIEAGPPPAAFTKDTPPKNFPGMQWNGEVNLTKNFLLECPDPVTGEIRYKTNDKGRYIKYESTLHVGIFPRQRRSIIPILHKRKQGQ